MVKTLAGMYFFVSAIALASEKPRVKDIGILGLMSHDLFSWDRNKQKNTENSRIDLSTIFEYQNGERIRWGGDPKNSENAPVFTISMKLVDFYKSQLLSSQVKNDEAKADARRKTVRLFHEWVADSFSRLSGMAIPNTGLDQLVNNDEQAAMRALHDILPGRIKLFRILLPIRELDVTDWKLARLRLNERELDQEIPFFDGQYAEEYRNIALPLTKTTLDLRAIDKKFVEAFTDLDFEAMQQELADLGHNNIEFQDLSFASILIVMMRKAICSENNIWMPDVPCG